MTRKCVCEIKAIKKIWLFTFDHLTLIPTNLEPVTKTLKNFSRAVGGNPMIRLNLLVIQFYLVRKITWQHLLLLIPFIMWVNAISFQENLYPFSLKISNKWVTDTGQLTFKVSHSSVRRLKFTFCKLNNDPMSWETQKLYIQWMQKTDDWQPTTYENITYLRM